METFWSHQGMENQTGQANINATGTLAANGPQRAPPTGPDHIHLKLQEPSQLFLLLNCESMKYKMDLLPWVQAPTRPNVKAYLTDSENQMPGPQDQPLE